MKMIRSCEYIEKSSFCWSKKSFNKRIAYLKGSHSPNLITFFANFKSNYFYFSFFFSSFFFFNIELTNRSPINSSKPDRKS